MRLYGSPPEKKGDHLWMLMDERDRPSIFYCMWCSLISSVGTSFSFTSRAGFDGAVKTEMDGDMRWFDGERWVPTKDVHHPPCPGPAAQASRNEVNERLHRALRWAAWWKDLARRKFLELHYRRELVNEARLEVSKAKENMADLESRAEELFHESDHAAARELDACIALMKNKGNWDAAMLLTERKGEDEQQRT